MKMVIARDIEGDPLMCAARDLGVFAEEGILIAKVFEATTWNEANKVLDDYGGFEHRPLAVDFVLDSPDSPLQQMCIACHRGGAE